MGCIKPELFESDGTRQKQVFIILFSVSKQLCGRVLFLFKDMSTERVVFIYKLVGYCMSFGWLCYLVADDETCALAVQFKWTSTGFRLMFTIINVSVPDNWVLMRRL